MEKNGLNWRGAERIGKVIGTDRMGRERKGHRIGLDRNGSECIGGEWP